MYTTLGAPYGATGGSNGAQSGSESRMSTLMVPLNGFAIMAPCVSRSASGLMASITDRHPPAAARVTRSG